MVFSTSVDDFRDVLKRSENIVVVAGAGLSAASGLPTFREKGGLWRSLETSSLATPSSFNSDPSLVWQFYHHRRVKALEASPNAAHRVLAELAIPSFLKAVAPAAKSYHLITQNVDRLSVKAVMDLINKSDMNRTSYDSDDPRLDSVIEMHGRLFDIQCTSCGHCEEDLSNPLCPALGRAEELRDSNAQTSKIKPESIVVEELPRCRQCGELARPGVVWFDEKPRKLDEINNLVQRADLCLVVGTSSTVRPASGYAYRIQRHHGTVAVFNIEPTPGDARADFVFKGPCEVELPRVLGIT
ncbi:DHS-like NAD/FAD-binding domain-containing protein [Lentinula aciculospora]|uniref:DHS-like NAD/FAD-binding domain-containing protein n=1 Tax=Lentinula aciculospora TaxID=153920 RepID=A0A9W9ABK3_9AGAR|nr:DHS-like NAD/FAD-binding domain-containing protein [Lentinula aciculospora]